MSIKIIKLEKSPLKNKRFRVYLNTGHHYDFGFKSGNNVGSTFIDHFDIDKRRNYYLRHLGNDKEKQLIMNLIPSASLFSLALLWGKYANINQNIDWLNSLFKLKYKS